MNNNMDDNFDMNDFVNFDQGFVASPTQASSHMDMSQAGPSASSAFPSTQAAMMHQQRQYNGPSHDYSQFPQQVGLPSGTTHHLDAVNAFTRQTVPAAFNPSRLVAYNTGFEMDAEPSTSADVKSFYPNDGFAEDFAVDPSALAPNASKSRAWPGMHSQQAKAQQDARHDQSQAHRQKSEQQMGLQRQLPTEFDHNVGNTSDRSDSTGVEVNDQISKLLHQMRQNSDMADLDENSQTNGDPSAMAKLKKDEDDMDEDERLLASEEGKKLTSKERRQLRNKVSARAFRSRRKEYIGQLEGEVNAKAAECDELKQTNRHLLEQNRQLTQLTKAMLAHPAFGNFMQDMSNDPSFLNSFASRQQQQQQQQKQQQRQPQQQQQTQQQQQQVPKQEGQHQQESIHVGMSMIPESNLDFSVLNLGSNSWNNFQQPQIFAVYDVPTPASANECLSTHLDPKSAAVKHTRARSCKLDMPVLSHPAGFPEPQKQTRPDVRHAMPRSGDLFEDDIIPSATPSPLLVATRQLEQSLFSKPPSVLRLRVSQPMDEATAVESVDRLFATLEDVSQRISAMTSHLPK